MNFSDEKLRELYEDYINYPNKVFNIFKDYFGEDCVDLHILTFEMFSKRVEDLREDTVPKDNVNQYVPIPNLLVWFPTVVIKNEEGREHTIKDLYVKVKLTYTGCIYTCFTMSRATYTEREIKSGYMHSHVNGIQYDPQDFQIPCLGSGPLRKTIDSLYVEYNEDLWRLFCYELDLYVQTESILGVPYRYLENIYNRELQKYSFYPITPSTSGSFYMSRYSIFKDFFLHLLENSDFKFCFINETLDIAMDFQEWVYFLSKEFIEWYNQKDNPYQYTTIINDLYTRGILHKGILKDDGLWVMERSGRGVPTFETMEKAYSDFNGSKVCDFKGKVIRVQINKDDTPEEDKFLWLFARNISTEFLYEILKIINYRNGNKTKTLSSQKRVVFL